jgi:hypothetical protein
MHETLARHPLTDAEVVHQLDCVLLQDAGPHPTFDVFAISLLNDGAIDSEGPQQQRQEHSRRSGADNADLSAQSSSTAE